MITAGDYAFVEGPCIPDGCCKPIFKECSLSLNLTFREQAQQCAPYLPVGCGFYGSVYIVHDATICSHNSFSWSKKIIIPLREIGQWSTFVRGEIILKDIEAIECHIGTYGYVDNLSESECPEIPRIGDAALTTSNDGLYVIRLDRIIALQQSRHLVITFSERNCRLSSTAKGGQAIINFRTLVPPEMTEHKDQAVVASFLNDSSMMTPKLGSAHENPVDNIKIAGGSFCTVMLVWALLVGRKIRI